MANNYLSDFQIVGTSVKDLKIKNDFINLNDGDNFKRKLDVSHSVTSAELVGDQERYFGTVLLNIKVTISLDKKKYSLNMSIEGGFTAPASLGETVFREMMQINGVTSLYSIARGFIQSTSSQMFASGSVLLPMFNVAAYSRNLDIPPEEE